MKNLILNGGYNKKSILFEKGKGDQIYFKGKKLTDLSHCSGSLIFGHNNSILVKSLKSYLKNKVSIFSHPNIYAVKFSKLIKEFFPNFQKIVFCNSGTEAVIKALRISSATNKKNLIVSVSGSWHGSVGKTLFYSDKNYKPKPISSGLDKENKKKIIFIPYNDIEKSKKILEKHKNKINCLLIEPVQAGLPLENVGSYLKFLEKFCRKNRINLIFDEIITGFRTIEGSVQSKYSIKPDITILGKVSGGGLPIGLIGINNEVFKKIKKNKLRVFFGGTFSANSMSSFVGYQTLKYLKSNKTKLKNLEKKCKYFQENLNKFLNLNDIDAKVYRFQNIIRIIFSRKNIEDKLQRDFLEREKLYRINLFRDYLFTKKIFYPNNGIIFFSTATSYQNIKKLLEHSKNFLKENFSVQNKK